MHQVHRLLSVLVVFLSTNGVVVADRTPFFTLDGPWTFCLVNNTEAFTAPHSACPTFRDPYPSFLPSDFSQFKTITLPHDFVVEGRHAPSEDVYHGYLPYTQGWYRTVVELPEMSEQMRLESDLWLRFEGVMRVSHVYINKMHMKTYVDGYTPFTVDI